MKNSFSRLWYTIRQHMDFQTPPGFEQTVGLTAAPVSIEDRIPPAIPQQPPVVHRSPAPELVQAFLKEHHIIQKYVAIPPHQSWIGNIFVQTDKPLLGITYLYEDEEGSE